MQTPKKLLLKGCARCHGDIVLDEVLENGTPRFVYQCLQCGRPIRLIGPEAARPSASTAT